MVSALLLTAATALAFYILVGYPLLLSYGFRRSAPKVAKDMQYRATVSVLMAVRNGEQFIRQKLESLLALNYPAELLEILVVSDGSTDGTDAIVAAFAGRGVRLLLSTVRGKPAALNLALRHAQGEILFCTDVRQAVSPDSLLHLVANFADPTVGAVTGEPRFLNPDRAGEEADMETYYQYELWARRRHSQIFSACNTTGWIYALRRELAESIPDDTLADDAVIPLKVLFRGRRVVVEPKALAFDFPKIQGGEFRRKVRTLGGLWQVHVRMPELYTGANRMRLHFLSHKTARLALPWALLLILGATIGLPSSPTRQLLLASDALLPALALLDYLLPKGFPLKRLSSPARSFLVMNLASLISIVVFFIPANRLWRPTQVTLSAPDR